MFSKTPIAWLQLTYRKSRLVVTLLGIVFAVLLMFMQLGFRDGLFADAITIHQTLQADLVLTHTNTRKFFGMTVFPRQRLYAVSALPGVAEAKPFYFSFGDFKNPETFTTKPILVCAFRLDKPVFDLPEVNQQLAVIKQANTVLFDRLSRNDYGPIATAFDETGDVSIELSKQNIKIGGLFSLGGGVLSVDGMMITSAENYARLLKRPLENIQMGLIDLEPGIDPEDFLASASPTLPRDVKLMTLESFLALEHTYWADSSPIGFIFNLGTLLGCIFGGIIVYQILYTQISDNIHIYATFRAIGYANAHLIGLVLQQAFLMSLIGYIPGFLFSLYLYQFVQEATRLPVAMMASRAAIVLCLTLVMCAVAGLLAIGKLRSADPADLFQ
ncbi:MAG: ABC transporter permease DevC [Phormidesmis sp.]